MPARFAASVPMAPALNFRYCWGSHGVDAPTLWLSPGLLDRQSAGRGVSFYAQKTELRKCALFFRIPRTAACGTALPSPS
jgi:hypothetical protein